jgi:hypothetical protein
MAVKFLGQFLLEKGLIDKDQLLAALDAQRASNPLLGELAQASGWLSASQAAQVNALQRSQDKPFGEIARALGLLRDAQVEALLAQQKSRRKLFGEILVELCILDAQQVGRALEMQASERESAVQGLDLGVAGHALEPVLRTAIETCNRLFVRTLKRRSQFSSLVENAADVAGCSIAGHVRVEAAAPLVVGIACDRATMNAIASAFLSLPGSSRDDALAQDALGELINVLMGYVVKETLAEDARYHAAPPDFSVPLDSLLEQGALAVSMVSELGSFVLLVGRGATSS